MIRFLLIFCSITIWVSLQAQEVIDGTFSFQDDDAKKYSIYVPSSYDATKAQALMIGFHPLNTNRWDAQSWRDTLIQFAESNDLLLACPDGGLDGRVDDPIDTAFTTLLLDSLGIWFNVDRDKQYAMGFSWGARTAYTYSLNHPGIFKGVIPIGAAIDGTDQFINVISNAANMDFYLVHGTNDNPAIRYIPVLTAFLENGVCHDTQLLDGVGHTIDFPMRNAILAEAFAFVSADNNCIASNTNNLKTTSSSIIVFPNPVQNKEINISNKDQLAIQSYEIFDLRARLCYQYTGDTQLLRTNGLLNGVFILKINHLNGDSELRKLVFFNK